MDIVDLHCDLLGYLAMSPDRTPDHPSVRCSIPQLKAGNVKTQVLALATETTIYSLNFGLRQLEIFLELEPQGLFVPAFENASAFAIENEPLDHILKRLEWILSQVTPLYISITWNGQNRFGGGCGTDAGLKPDGEELLKFLSGRGIRIDFSHATDRLARETLNFIDKHSLDVPVMASHSNFRTVHEHVRNLPDDIAKEIIARDGVIGLVFYNKFLKDPSQLFDMIEYGLKLGGEKALCFGADFFCTEDLWSVSTSGGDFHEEMSDSSKYPSILENLRSQGIEEDLLRSIAHENADRVIERSVYSEQ